MIEETVTWGIGLSNIEDQPIALRVQDTRLLMNINHAKAMCNALAAVIDAIEYAQPETKETTE